MNFEGFYEWLIEIKNMSTRSAKDVICRCRRVCKMLQIDNIDNFTLVALNSFSELADKSMFIKSQLRRAVVLYTEFGELLSGQNAK